MVLRSCYIGTRAKLRAVDPDTAALRLRRLRRLGVVLSEPTLSPYHSIDRRSRVYSLGVHVVAVMR
jgi:hypothetical protein